MEAKDTQEYVVPPPPPPSTEHATATTPTFMRVKRLSTQKVEMMSMSQPSESQDMDDDVVQFHPPAKGTPAAEALQANADIKVSRLEKGIRRIKGIKHPKAKNITKLMKKKKDRNRAFSRNFKGKVIDGVHELYTVTAGMIFGLRYSVGRSNTNSVQDLLLGDFSYVEKISFPPNGSNQPPFRTPSHQLAHTFKFKTYAPRVFSKLREFFGVDSISYMLSVCGDYNYLEFISNSKSGQFFFYSHDGRYMIKTQTNEENKFMKRILPHYYRYVTENPHTFLVRIYGMHRVKMYHLNRKTHFVIMQSVFDSPVQIQSIYDLKGSVIGRNASQKERESGGVLKDNDLIADGVKLQLGPKRQAIIDQLEKDANFLAELNIMDYSVLLGIHNRDKRSQSDADITQISTSFNKRRSVVPFLQKDLHDTSGKIEPTVEHRIPIKKRRSKEQHDSLVKKSEESKRITRDNGTIDVTSSEVVSDNDDSIYSQNGDSFCEDDYYYDEDDDDAGDSDIGSICSGLALSNANRNAAVRVLSSEFEDDNADEKKIKDLTGSNLNAVGKKPNVAKPHASGDASSIHSSSMYATIGSATVGSHTDISPSSSGDDVDDEDAGIGLAGEEGKAISKMFKDNIDLSAVASAGNRLSYNIDVHAEMTVEHRVSRNITFGPGSSGSHPWTSRFDGGINSRMENGTRGKYIYYIGIIDILQQYNASKRIETVFKSLKYNKNEISSVDSVSYAKRFVQFMKDNTV